MAYGKPPDFKAEQFCCLQVGKKWKLHHFDGEAWKRINTELPADATECSPTAEFIDGKWQVSFVVGDVNPDRKFRLYKIDDLENSLPKVVCEAEVGFVWKNRIVFGKRSGGLYVSDTSKTQKLTFADVEYLYRVSYNPSNPNELLISGQYKSGKLFSWACNPVARTLQSLTVNGKSAYKAAFFGNTLFYTERGDSDGFEERHIVSSETYEKTPLNFDEVVSVETEKPHARQYRAIEAFYQCGNSFCKVWF